MKKEIRWILATLVAWLFSSAAFALSDIDPPGVTEFDTSLVLMPPVGLARLDTDNSDSLAFIIKNFPDVAVGNFSLPEQTDYGWHYLETPELVSVDASHRHMRYEVGWQYWQA